MELNGVIVHGLSVDVETRIGDVNITLSNGTHVSLVDAKEYELSIALGPIGNVIVADLSNYYTKDETNAVISSAFEAYELTDEQINEICV